MKHTPFAIGLVALSLTLDSCGHKAKEATPEMTVDVAVPEVKSIVLRQSYPATIKALREVRLVARVNGYLRSCNYTYGDFVKKGTVLFTIEDTNYRDAVNRAESDLNTAIANQKYAATRYAAMTEALKSDAVSKIEVEQAKSTLEECNAAIKSAEAALQSARTQLSYCTVRAPFDGHVSSAMQDVGSYLGGEGAPVDLATIYEDKTMVVYVSIDDASTMTEIKKAMQSGSINIDSIPVTFTGGTKKQYTAKLDYMSPDVSTSTGTIELQGLIDNTDGELRSGMFANIAMPLGTDSAAILIRDSSIASDQLGKYVYTVNDSNKFVYTPVKTGELYRDTLRIINSGLDKSSRYVTKALLKVRDGMEVKPVLTK